MPGLSRCSFEAIRLLLIVYVCLIGVALAITSGCSNNDQEQSTSASEDTRPLAPLIEPMRRFGLSQGVGNYHFTQIDGVMPQVAYFGEVPWRLITIPADGYDLYAFGPEMLHRHEVLIWDSHGRPVGTISKNSDEGTEIAIIPQGETHLDILALPIENKASYGEDAELLVGQSDLAQAIDAAIQRDLTRRSALRVIGWIARLETVDNPAIHDWLRGLAYRRTQLYATLLVPGGEGMVNGMERERTFVEIEPTTHYPMIAGHAAALLYRITDGAEDAPLKAVLADKVSARNALIGLNSGDSGSPSNYKIRITFRRGSNMVYHGNVHHGTTMPSMPVMPITREMLPILEPHFRLITGQHDEMQLNWFFRINAPALAGLYCQSLYQAAIGSDNTSEAYRLASAVENEHWYGLTREVQPGQSVRDLLIQGGLTAQEADQVIQVREQFLEYRRNYHQLHPADS